MCRCRQRQEAAAQQHLEIGSVRTQNMECGEDRALTVRATDAQSHLVVTWFIATSLVFLTLVLLPYHAGYGIRHNLRRSTEWFVVWPNS